MDKYIYDEKNRLHYKLVSDYYLPCLEAPKAPQIGVWGHRRRTYLLEHNKALYTAMLLSDELDAHLETIDRDAEQMFERLTHQYATTESLTEELKANDPMTWVQQMNNIHNRAKEVVHKTFISG